MHCRWWLLAAGLLCGCAAAPQAVPGGAEDQHYVVLLHGLARSERSMRKMERALAGAGYGTCNIDYPSTRHPIEVLLRDHVRPAIEDCLPSAEVGLSFVTHSLGGILVRLLLRETRLDRLRRVVMLSPPNQGSEVVDALGDLWLFEFMNGPAGAQLGTDADSLPNRLGPADFEVGVITGNRSINLILSSIIPGPDDGKVAVARARLAGMRDFLVVPVSHPFIMGSDEVIRQTLEFLENGRFRGP
jgi:pimeloyl-ACP methyl ester carboxylesterase